MNYAQLERQAAELQMSPTMSKLVQFAQMMPIDTNDTDERNTALCTITVDLIRAIDADRIHFDNSDDRALFHGLLLTALQIVFNGRFGEGAERARAQ